MRKTVSQYDQTGQLMWMAEKFGDTWISTSREIAGLARSMSLLGVIRIHLMNTPNSKISASWGTESFPDHAELDEIARIITSQLGEPPDEA